MLLLPALLCAFQALPDRAQGAHGAQAMELGEVLQRVAPEALELLADRHGQQKGANVYGSDTIVFGYLQSEVQVPHTRWHALSHLGSRFVSFDGNGNLTGTSAFTARSPLLKAGGAAQAAGVRMVLVVNQFDDAPGGVLETVMTSPAARANLVLEITTLLASDSYVHGVNLDFEFSWGPTVRDGITLFCHELRAALDGLDPTLESSVYVGAFHSASQWDFDASSGVTPSVDYVLYSMYDWATGTTAHAISDFNSCLGPTRLHGYLDAGLPPEKLVLTLSTYSRRWNGTGAYNGVGTSSSSSGFTDAMFDVTLNPAGPFFNQHRRGDEAGWYAGTAPGLFTRTWESPEALELELRHALSLQDPNASWEGRRARGVGFWSLFWLAETSSFDPRTAQNVARTRTYPHVYRLCQDVFLSRGEGPVVLDGFAGLDPRWRDPSEALDTFGDFDGDSNRSLVSRPSVPRGTGVPADGSRTAIAFGFDFEETGRAVLAHEILCAPSAPGVPDMNAALGHVDLSSVLSVRVHVPAAYPGTSLRLLLLDADHELESSPPFALDGAGWSEMRWELNTTGSQGLPTAEPLFFDGDGILDSAGAGARDLAVYGFAIESQAAGSGTVVLDELRVEPHPPGGRRYRLNELRYADPSAEFVEIHGPAGPIPAGLQLVAHAPSTGASIGQRALSGTIVDRGDGTGFHVIGDPGVPGVNQSLGFAAGQDDIPDQDPASLVLRDSTTGFVHDTLIYEAFGGIDELARLQTNGATRAGSPWAGEVATGRDTTGQRYSLGRAIDGASTGSNAADFTFQRASPGAANHTRLSLPASFDFEAPPPELFQTYDSPKLVDPVSAGLPRAVNGGLAYRCVDTAGGGLIGVLGGVDPGARRGFTFEGELYLPASTAPAQAVAVGVLGRQGSTFFTASALDRSGYESGIWLIFENRAGVGLADGRPDHPLTFELVHASHDNQDAAPVDLLADLPLSGTSFAPGQWIPFRFRVEPFSTQDALEVEVGGVRVYRGPLPDDAPRSGAIQIGFRENHAGSPDPGEGTWIDGVTVRAVQTGPELFETR